MSLVSRRCFNAVVGATALAVAVLLVACSAQGAYGQSVNVTLAPPLLLWQRAPVVGVVEIPDGPNVVYVKNQRVLVEFRVNTSTSTGFIRGINVSSGSVLWTFSSICATIQFLADVDDGVHFVVGCTDHVLVCAAISGAMTNRLTLPIGLSLCPMSGTTPLPYQFTALIPKKVLILSVLNTTAQATSLYGSMLLSLNFFNITTPNLVEVCPPGTTVDALLTAPGEHGYSQVCSAAQVSYVTIASVSGAASVAWRYVNATLVQNVAAAAIYAGGASLANPCVAFPGIGYNNAWVLGFTAGGTTATPSWSTLLAFGPVIALTSLGETVLALTASTVIALEGATGALSWSTATPEYVTVGAILTDSLLAHSVFIIAQGSVYQLSSMTGTVLSTAAIGGNLALAAPAFAVAAPIQRLLYPMDELEPSIGTSAAAEWMIVIGAGPVVAAWNCSASGCGESYTLSQTFSEASTAVQGPLIVVPPNINDNTASSIGHSLVVGLTSGIQCISLSFGWEASDAAFQGMQDSVVIVNTNDGMRSAALDRTGRVVWTQDSPFDSFASSPVPFLSNIVLDIDGGGAVSVLHTYDGALLTTLRLRSDCYANQTSPWPMVTTLIADDTNGNVYFTGGVPCLFRIASDLTLHALPLTLSILQPPVIDVDNGLAYLINANEIRAVSIPLGLTQRSLFVSASTILRVIPSSTWSSVQNLRRGLNALVYVVTDASLHALDVLSYDSTLVWSLSLPGIVSVEFFSNQLYVASQTSGICALALNVSIPSSQRLLWCVGGAEAASQPISRVVITPNAVVLAVIGAQLFAVDAISGRGRLSPSGSLALPTNTICTAITFDADHYLAYVGCGSGVVYAVDVTQVAVGNVASVVFAVGGTTTQTSSLSIDYYNNVLYLLSAYDGQMSDQSGVIGIPLLPALVNRRGSVPLPFATLPPMPETVPPNYVPLPQPTPPPPPYPSAASEQSYPILFSTLTVGTSADPVGAGSALPYPAVFPGVAFTTPACNDSGICTLAAYNVSTGEPLWMTPFTVPPDQQQDSFSCGTVFIAAASSLVGLNASAEASLVMECGGAVFAYAAATGAPRWNTTALNYTDLVVWNVDSTYGNPVVLALNDTNVIALDAVSGAVVFELPAEVAANSMKMFYPSGKNIAFLVLVGEGVQVVELGPRQQQYTITLLVVPGTPPGSAGFQPLDQFCLASYPVFIAAPASSSTEEGIYLDEDTAYFACVHLVQAHSVAVFQIHLLTSSVISLVNISFGSSTAISGMLVVSEETGGSGSSSGSSSGAAAEPVLYVALNTLLYQINVTSRKIRWIALGSFGPLIGGASGIIFTTTPLDVQTNSATLQAWSASTGSALWNMTVSGAPLAQLGVTFLSRILAVELPGTEILLVGAGGVYGIHRLSGKVLFASQTSNDGFVRSFVVTSASDRWSVGGGDGTPVLVTVAYLSSSSALLHTLLAVASSLDPMSGQPQRFIASPPWSVCACAAASNVSLGLIVQYQDHLVLHTAHRWTAAQQDVTGIHDLLIDTVPGTTSVEVTLVFNSFYVNVYGGNNGILLGRYLFADACPVALSALDVDPDVVQIGTNVYFLDVNCLYKLNVTARTLTAVVLSDQRHLSTGSGNTFSTSDSSSILCMGLAGVAFRVNAATLAVEWVNDVFQFYGLMGLSSLLLPEYPPSVPLAEQQLIGLSNTGVASMSVGNGSVVWLQYLLNIYAAVVVSDGNLIVATMDGVFKLSMDVTIPAGNRTLWSFTYPPSWFVFSASILQIPNTNALVVLAYVLMAIDISNGTVLWINSDYPAMSGLYTSGLVAATNPRQSQLPSPLIVESNGLRGLSAYDTESGELLYQSSSVGQASAAVVNGWLAADVAAGVEVAPLWFPNRLAASRLPSMVTAPVPTIPAQFPPVPLMPNSSATQFPMTFDPSPVALWTMYAPIADSAVIDVTVAFTGEVNAVSVWIQWIQYSATYSSPKRVMAMVVDALQGVVLASADWTSQCANLKWGAQLNAHYAVLFCNDNSKPLVFVDIATSTNLTIMTSSNVTDKAAYSTLQGTLALTDYHIGCVATSFTVLTCFRADPRNTTAMGMIAYAAWCPGTSESVGAPLYQSDLELIVVGCTSSLTAIQAASGVVQWSVNITNGTLVRVALSGNFAAVLLDGDLPPTIVGPFAVQTYSLLSGAPYSPLVCPLPDEQYNDVSGLYLVEAATFPAVDLRIIVVTPSKVIGYSTLKKFLVWDVYLGCSYGSCVTTTTYPQDPVTGREALYVVTLPQSGGSVLYGVDAINGTVWFTIHSQVNANWSPQSAIVFTHGLGVSLFVTSDQAGTFYDLVRRSLLFSFPFVSYASAVVCAVFLRNVPGDGGNSYALVLDVATNDGNIHQALANASGTVAVSTTAFAKAIVSNATVEEYLVTAETDSTFVYNATGAPLWATFVSTSNSYTPGLIPVILNLPGADGGQVLVNQFAPRTYYGFDMQNGSLLFAGFLPLCDGEGTEDPLGGGAGATMYVDAFYSRVYVTGINLCVYAINLVSQLVEFTPMPQRQPLLGASLVTPTCLVVMDAYGTVSCVPRGVNLNTSPEPLWTFSVGFVPNVEDVRLEVLGTTVVVSTGNLLLCFLESTGQILFQKAVGPRISFVPYNATVILVRTETGAYRISALPNPPQRTDWFVSRAYLVGSAPVLAQDEAVQPVVTANGNFVFFYGGVLFALHVQTGAVVFERGLGSYCSGLLYTAQSTPLDRIVFATCNQAAYFVSAVDGSVVGFTPFASPFSSTNAVALFASTGRIAFPISVSATQLTPVPDFLIALAPPIQPVATSPPESISTLPPGFTPQGLFTPLPSLQPGVTLPKLSCVLNMEALLDDLLACVNAAIGNAYLGRSPDSIPCAALAANLSDCTATWLSHIVPDCPGAAIYLNEVLAGFNTSQALNFCTTPTRCGDGNAGAQQICAVTRAAENPSGGATFAPQLVLPSPLRPLPQFTAPPSPSTTTTTKAPASTTTTTSTPQSTSNTAAPAHSAAPASTTTTVAPPPSTTAPPVSSSTTTTTAVPSTTATSVPMIMYQFLCKLPFGQTQAPQNFAYLVGRLVGLHSDANIVMSSVAPSVGTTRPSFTFYFVGDNALAESASLDQQVSYNAVAVAQSLALYSISAFPYIPTGGAQNSPGLSASSLAGIIIAVLVACGLGALAFAKRKQLLDKYRSSRTTRRGLLNPGAIQEDDYGATPTRRELDDVGSGSGPAIYTSL